MLDERGKINMAFLIRYERACLAARDARVISAGEFAARFAPVDAAQDEMADEYGHMAAWGSQEAQDLSH